ncbi:unnamed protein product [Ixodes persulcatus]
MLTIYENCGRSNIEILLYIVLFLIRFFACRLFCNIPNLTYLLIFEKCGMV